MFPENKKGMIPKKGRYSVLGMFLNLIPMEYFHEMKYYNAGNPPSKYQGFHSLILITFHSRGIKFGFIPETKKLPFNFTGTFSFSFSQVILEPNQSSG